MASLTFLGAAGTVTGSKHLLEIDGTRILVDCGLFQGLKELRERNWAPFPVDVKSIHAVILTHAHLDHCGYLPRLVAQGFRGRIFCTPGTQDLCGLILRDAAKIQEEDARDANKYNYGKHTPALPLYTQVDAERALTLLQPVGFNRPVPVSPGVEVEFINAGHLLGSAYARVRAAGKTILFGGDLGRYGRPVLPDPTPVEEADILLVESTYGNKLHEHEDDATQLAAIVNDTFKRGGKLIIPAFAVGRVEEVLYWLRQLEAAKRIPALPVYVDSPMAQKALQFYANRTEELDPDIHTAAARGVRVFATERLTIVASPQQSKDLVASHKPAIVIASSGMATGGRVLYHLAAGLPDPRNTVLFVGFQAAGTRGRTLIEGATEVRMKGRDVRVVARIERLNSMSAHADRGEITRWLGGFTRPPSMTFLVHGEPLALESLKGTIEATFEWPVHIARYEERVELGF